LPNTSKHRLRQSINQSKRIYIAPSQANQRRMLGWTRQSVYVRCTQSQTVQFSEHAGNYWKTQLTYSCKTGCEFQTDANSKRWLVNYNGAFRSPFARQARPLCLAARRCRLPALREWLIDVWRMLLYELCAHACPDKPNGLFTTTVHVDIALLGAHSAVILQCNVSCDIAKVRQPKIARYRRNSSEGKL